MRSALPAVIIACAATLLLGGCVPQEPVVVPPVEQQSEPVFASDEEALAAATDAYKAYLEMSDLIAQEGGKDPERIAQVAVGEALNSALEGYEHFRQRTLHSTGESRMSGAELQRYSDDSTETEDVAAIYACLDLSDVDVLDVSGKSVVKDTRPSLQTFEVTFNRHPKQQSELIVASRTPWGGSGICGD
jgi:hypothetical protein